MPSEVSLQFKLLSYSSHSKSLYHKHYVLAIKPLQSSPASPICSAMQLCVIYTMLNTVRHPGLNHAQNHSILQVKLIARIQTLERPSYCQEPPAYTPEGRVKGDHQEEFTNRRNQLSNGFISLTQDGAEHAKAFMAAWWSSASDSSHSSKTRNSGHQATLYFATPLSPTKQSEGFTP